MPTITLTDLEGVGTSSIPIYSLMPFNSTQSLIISNEGHHWLRTGHVTDDVSTYPLFTSYEDPDELVQVIGDPFTKTQWGLPVYMRIK